MAYFRFLKASNATTKFRMQNKAQTENKYQNANWKPSCTILSLATINADTISA